MYVKRQRGPKEVFSQPKGKCCFYDCVLFQRVLLMFLLFFSIPMHHHLCLTQVIRLQQCKRCSGEPLIYLPLVHFRIT